MMNVIHIHEPHSSLNEWT